MSASSSSSSFRPIWTYDVFLSFRGKDTRKNFTDHLYNALVDAGIHTFLDDNTLPKGENIAQILNAIQQSKISIVVFSKGYASSPWCLDELVQIMVCEHAIGQIVLPIFYDIDPSHVQDQTGVFAEAFQIHEEQEEIEKVNRWRGALAEASNLSGWDLHSSMANGYESKFIKEIVHDVFNKLKPKGLNVAKHPVGLCSRVSEILTLLTSNTSDDIHIVGIHGMGGIGKTTIAKAVFNEFYNRFEGSCFLSDVKDKSKQHMGVIELQEQLLCEILKIDHLKINNVDAGVNLIKQRLGRKRVLVVIDDIDQSEQLDKLVGGRSCFGSGSSVIITTRDEHLLTWFKVDEKYQVKELDTDESLQLFNWHAFRDTHPGEDYLKLSKDVMRYCGGLPLALELLGSHLLERSVAEWESTIKKLREIPHQPIQKILRISFDALDDDRVRGIFLDIACFFIGWNKDYVAAILEGRGFFPEIGINILIERSLLKIGGSDVFNMHDLVRDMGREIVREISPEHAEKRCRIWFHGDAWSVLYKEMGTDHVEGLKINLRNPFVPLVRTESFKGMRYLKLLQIDGVNLIGSYKHFSKELTWLRWHRCPLKFFPSNFIIDNLSVIDMQHSNINEFWKETKYLNKLKIFNLSYSKYLTSTPNFHSFSLEELILEGCSSLVKVHESIGSLKRLVSLNLRRCCRLKDLPESMCSLKSLKALDITMCSKLNKLPNHLGDMESLTQLLADETAIQQLPSSIGNLKNLRKLTLWKNAYNQASPSFSVFRALATLELSDCWSSEGSIPVDFGSLSSLKDLNLSGNRFPYLPSGIGCLNQLQTLKVDFCKNLLSIPELPSNLVSLNAFGCSSLERILIRSETMPQLSLRCCEKLIEIQGLENLTGESYQPMHLLNCTNLANTFKDALLQGSCKRKHGDIEFPVDEIPDWFSHCGDTYSSILSFNVPAASEGKLEGLLVWIVFEPKTGFYYPNRTNRDRDRIIRDGWSYVYFTIRNKSCSSTLLIDLRHTVLFGFISCNHSLVRYIPSVVLGSEMRGGEQLELSADGYVCNPKDDIWIRRVGVHLIVEKPENTAYSKGNMIPTTYYLDVGRVGEEETEGADNFDEADFVTDC